MPRISRMVVPQKETLLIDLTISSDDEEDTPSAGKKPRVEDRVEQREPVAFPRQVKPEPPPKESSRAPPVSSSRVPPLSSPGSRVPPVSSSPAKPPSGNNKFGSAASHPPLSVIRCSGLPPADTNNSNRRSETEQKRGDPTTSSNPNPHSPNKEIVKSTSSTPVVGTGRNLSNQIPGTTPSSAPPLNGSNLGPKKLYLQKNSLPQGTKNPIPSSSTSGTIIALSKPIPAIPEDGPAAPLTHSVTMTPAPSSSSAVATSQAEPTKDLTTGASKETMPTSVSPTNNSDSDKAPVLEPEPVTEPRSSNSPQSPQPPTLYPEVDVPVLTAPDSNCDEAMASAQRSWLHKFKIPKKPKPGEKQVPSPSSANNHRPSTATSTAAGLRSKTKRVAHQRGPANLKATLSISARLLRTVEEFKKNYEKPYATRERSHVPVFKINSPKKPTSVAFPHKKVPTKRAEKETNKHSNKSPEQTLLLEKKFEETPELLPTDLLELVTSTGLNKSQIQHWFAIRRKKLKDDSENEPPNSGFPSVVEEPSNVGNSGDIIIDDDDDDDVTPSSFNHSADHAADDSGKGKKLKFLRRPELRTTDIATLKADLDKVETCPLEHFRKIVECMWDKKARNIVHVVNTQKETKTVILREAKRIKDQFRVDPFSQIQHEELAIWKQQFLDKMTKENPNRAQNTHTVEEYIYPWVVPFIYSKVATQDGLYLSLEVALHDFSKLYDCGTVHKWYTPSYIAF